MTDKEIEVLAELQVEKEGWGKYDGTPEQNGIKNSFIEGYKTAQASLYTEEDLRVLANRVADFCKNHYNSEEYIQQFVSNFLLTFKPKS